MAGLQDDLSEYDALTVDVAIATYDLFQPTIQRWFDLVDETPLFYRVAAQLERGIDFQKWWRETTEGDEYGQTQLTWPKGSDGRLGMQLLMYRAFATGKPDVLGFYMSFLRSSGFDRYDDMLAEVRRQVFDPMARDLRRRFERAAQAEAAGEVPASDRVVKLDHNRPELSEANDALDKVAEAVRAANDYEDDDDREQRLAEVSASKSLLSSVRVRADAVIALVFKVLRYLASKFADKAIGAAAGAALAIIGKWTGLW